MATSVALLQQINQSQIGSYYAHAVSGDADARGGYVREGHHAIEVWLVTDAIGFEDEDRFFDIALEMKRAFTNVDIDFHLLNPSMYDEQINPVHDLLPPGVQRVELSR